MKAGEELSLSMPVRGRLLNRAGNTVVPQHGDPAVLSLPFPRKIKRGLSTPVTCSYDFSCRLVYLSCRKYCIFSLKQLLPSWDESTKGPVSCINTGSPGYLPAFRDEKIPRSFAVLNLNSHIFIFRSIPRIFNLL